MKALEYFLSGRDLFVSTGTGSGKTECFLWPIISKCFGEAKNRPNAFKMKAVRGSVMGKELVITNMSADSFVW